MPQTVDSTDRTVQQIDITRRGLRLVGKPADITRVLRACQDAMRRVELNGSFHDPIVVGVKPPDPDEP